MPLRPQNWRFEQEQAADAAARRSPRAAYHPNGRCNGKGSQTNGGFDPMQLCFKALENTPESLVITSPKEPDNPIVWCNQVHPSPHSRYLLASSTPAKFPRLQMVPLGTNSHLLALQGFLRMTGYSEDEVLGRNCRFLQASPCSVACSCRSGPSTLDAASGSASALKAWCTHWCPATVSCHVAVLPLEVECCPAAGLASMRVTCRAATATLPLWHG